MGGLIDTSVLIEIERGNLAASILASPAIDLAISAISVSELLQGVHGAARGVRRTTREAWIERLLALLPVIPFDLPAARIHASLPSRMKAKGHGRIGGNDLIIAATALSRGLSVVTRDKKSFPKVPELTVMSW